MKIAIISDSHDNLVNLKKVSSLVKKERIKTIIHCGDVASTEILKEAFPRYKGKILVSLGNLDRERDFPIKNTTHLKVYPDYGKLGKIAFCHFPETAKKLAKSGKYEIVFYGHTHKPLEETIGKTKMVNPGNIAGIIYRATFATYDNGKLKLIIL